MNADEPGWAARWRPTRGDENVLEREKVQTGSRRTGQVPKMNLTRVAVVD